MKVFSHTSDVVEELLRTIGFVAAPQLLYALAVTPFDTWRMLVGIVVLGMTFVAFLHAIRHPLDVDTRRALDVAALAALRQFLIVAAFGLVAWCDRASRPPNTIANLRRDKRRNQTRQTRRAEARACLRKCYAGRAGPESRNLSIDRDIRLETSISIDMLHDDETLMSYGHVRRFGAFAEERAHRSGPIDRGDRNLGFSTAPHPHLEALSPVSAVGSGMGDAKFLAVEVQFSRLSVKERVCWRFVDEHVLLCARSAGILHCIRSTLLVRNPTGGTRANAGLRPFLVDPRPGLARFPTER